MKTTAIAAAITLILSGFAGYASANTTEDLGSKDRNAGLDDQHHQDFLGCVADDFDCAQLADDRGMDEHWLRTDSRCSSPQQSCWGEHPES